MFTGIVTRGEVARLKQSRGVLEIEVHAPGVARALEPGDSVSVGGVCLTARRVRRKRFVVEATNESVARSTLGLLAKHAAVNLELPLRAGDRLGGHIVQGHVDATARLRLVEPDGDSKRMWFSPPAGVLRYMVPKGSVAVDGVSLTVVDASEQDFEVMIIPHTLETTTLGTLAPGDDVNVEIDVMAKYAEKLMPATPPRPR